MSELMLIWIRMEEFLHSTFLDVEIWRIIVAGLIIIFTLTIRKILVNLLIAVLKRITAKTKTELDDQLVNAIEPPARLIVITAGILIAVRVLGLETAGDSFLGRFIRSMFIFSVFWAVYRAAGVFSGLFERFSSKTSTRLDDLLVPFINKGIKVIVVIIGISVIASEWEYDLGAFLAGLGLGGLAFALAAQETLANFFGGLTIMVDKPFAIGDWITCSGVEGLVEDIGFRSTKVRTAEQALVNVPNSIIAKAAVTNCNQIKNQTEYLNTKKAGRYKYSNGYQQYACNNQNRELIKMTIQNDHPH
jgi:MscS family membrane protein